MKGLGKICTMAITSLLISASVFVLNSYAATYHSISVDGTNDFSSDEMLGSSSTGINWYITWNSSNFFIGADVMPSQNNWITVYLDTDPQIDPESGQGSLVGNSLNTQTPLLPFTANYSFLYNTYNQSLMPLEWNGSQWVSAADFITGAQSDVFSEFSISRAEIGNPNNLYMLSAIVNETDSSEWTYGMLPHLNGPDSYDPNFSHWLGYSLVEGVSPNLDVYVDATVPIPGAVWLLGSGLLGLVGLRRKLKK